jgi:(1->4)-alpha-D-glucan 1-alpha-D-glucosylmutase
MRIPTSTYRLQLNAGFRFSDAAAVVEYLDALGITDCYASPLSMARPGSVHGYDVVEPTRLNPELGSEQDFQSFAGALRERRMGLLLDVVPNHMCIDSVENWRWRDVLSNGPSSIYARFFDVDWRPPKDELVGKVLLPVLGDQFGRVLESGITVAYEEDGSFCVAFDGRRLPLDTRTWPHLLDPALAELRARFGDEEPRVLELESIIRAIGYLPKRTETTPAKVRERRHEQESIGRRLSTLVADDADTRGAIERSAAEINERKGDPRGLDRLEALLAQQAYRLSHWRVAADEINYRRFFDINDLAAIRVEDPVVFQVVHELPMRLAREGIVTGLRIDHVDGLLDPEKYLHDLQRGFREAQGQTPQTTGPGPPCYVVVEKILARNERIPVEWPVQGATGYELAALLSAALVDPAGGPPLRALAAQLEEEPARFSDVVYESKKLVLRTAMSAELNVLARRLDRISEQHRYTRDFTFNSLHEVLAEVIACFPVYRTYIRPGDTAVDERDRRPIETAVRLAKRRNPVTNESLFDFLRSVLFLDAPDGISDVQRTERREFVLRFQQLTGPVMAKGLEDTAYYRYFPLAALNEVGGGPDLFGMSTADLHRQLAERMVLYPHGLSATATHDTKRGEDTRARMLVLSELPEIWAEAVGRWRHMNRPHRVDVAGVEAPSPAEEYLFYQTLIGAWPPGDDCRPGLPAASGEAQNFVERIRQYMHKALLEAKVQTSWINHNEPYEQAVDGFVSAALDPQRSGPFLEDLGRFLARVVRPGYWNSLSQVLLKVAAPGVPDFYQGSELWDFSLVDPDNRRPVDYRRRRTFLRALQTEAAGDATALAERLLAAPEDGRIKMLVVSRALAFRRTAASLFQAGSYHDLQPTGARADSVIAFARVHEAHAAIAVVGRHFIKLGEDASRPVGAAWGDTKLAMPGALAGRRWRNVITGARVGEPSSNDGRALPVRELLAHLPVALLESTTP